MARSEPSQGFDPPFEFLEDRFRSLSHDQLLTTRLYLSFSTKFKEIQPIRLADFERFQLSVRWTLPRSFPRFSESDCDIPWPLDEHPIICEADQLIPSLSSAPEMTQRSRSRAKIEACS